MAARKSGSDLHNNGPVSYLDDVPFKLNEKFRCPEKVGLPIGFCLPDINGLLSETQYDFSLEKRSVRWGDDLAKARDSEVREAELRQAESEKDRQAALQDSEAGLAGGKKARPADEQDLLPPALNPVLAGLRHNAILTPLPAPSFGPAQPAANNPAPQSLNLADFEREEDPFDKLELKTLDDKEELRSILQSQPQASVSVSTPENTGGEDSAATPQQDKMGVFHKPNGLVGLLDLEHAGVSGVSISKGQIDTERPCNIRSLTFPKLSDPGDSPVDSPFTVFSAAPQRNFPNGTPQSLLRSTPHTSSTFPVELPGHAPNSTPNGTPMQPNPAPPVGPPSCLASLSPSERQCVETVVGMGYSYEGVRRAMQTRGQDVEQVLEYLFVHSRLCERGFDTSAVEECLEMYQCSEEKALQFLQLMSRFGEMGFERNTIKEVLLAHNNDQEKALDDLMARAAAS